MFVPSLELFCRYCAAEHVALALKVSINKDANGETLDIFERARYEIRTIFVYLSESQDL